MTTKNPKNTAYVRIKGRLILVQGLLHGRKNWKIACEHTNYMGACVECGLMVVQASDAEIEYVGR